ncbi:MAG: geranylgeranyl diphosphate synthase type II [Myxococcota bacterium]|jgi:geranylgeranyl diphosphate synthase type II
MTNEQSTDAAIDFDIDDYMDNRRPLVDAQLEKLVAGEGEPPVALHGAMRHLLFPSGKRFRPVLAIAAAEAVGGSAEAALPIAAAVELIHTYSLVHDDLPCMDDDALRRGRPTVHVVYGEAVAVLAGDALQCLAFEVLAGAANSGNALAVSQTLADLAHTAGSRQLVGGQADDLVYDSSRRDPQEIESVHARKSAALIATSIAGGARLAGATDKQVDELYAFGIEVGVAFQIADDLLDEDEEDQCSLAHALGHDGAVARAEELLASALARIEDLGESANPLRALARFAVQRKV